MTRPDCNCHNMPMRWNKDSRYTAGGFWRCAARGRLYCRHRYRTDPAYAEACRQRSIRAHEERVIRDPLAIAKETLRKRRYKALVRAARRPHPNPKVAQALRAVKRREKPSGEI